MGLYHVPLWVEWGRGWDNHGQWICCFIESAHDCTYIIPLTFITARGRHAAPTVELRQRPWEVRPCVVAAGGPRYPLGLTPLRLHHTSGLGGCSGTPPHHTEQYASGIHTTHSPGGHVVQLTGLFPLPFVPWAVISLFYLKTWSLQLPWTA